MLRARAGFCGAPELDLATLRHGVADTGRTDRGAAVRDRALTRATAVLRRQLLGLAPQPIEIGRSTDWDWAEKRIEAESVDILP